MAFILPSYSASIFSKYGVIQNVQDYSTNPSWNPNSPYNVHLPRPVYAFGPQVGTDDCLQIVYDLVAITCSGMNNCVNAELSDVRPSVMLQLSRITTGNYATSCGGYIDGVFYKYITQNGHNIQDGNIVAFPTPNTNTIQPIQIENPFTPQAPDWAIEFQERKQELQDLQSQNGTNVYGVESTPFPTTYADLSFTERMENEKQGYEPYKDKHAYERVKINNMPKTKTTSDKKDKEDNGGGGDNGGNGGNGGGGTTDDFTGGAYAILYSNNGNLQQGTIYPYSEANPRLVDNCSSPNNDESALYQKIISLNSIQDPNGTNFFFDPIEETRVFPGLLMGSTYATSSTSISDPKYEETVVTSKDPEKVKNYASQLAYALKNSACVPGNLYVVQLHNNTKTEASAPLTFFPYDSVEYPLIGPAAEDVLKQFPDSHLPVKIVSQKYEITYQ